MNFKFSKTENVNESVAVANSTYLDSTYGELKEGYNPEQNVEVNIVSRKKIKKDYQVGGVLDQEQNNNWKAWLYLAPVLILMAVFLIFPLINPIAIAFLKDYSYVEGTSSGLTFDNFLEVNRTKFESKLGKIEKGSPNYNMLKNTYNKYKDEDLEGKINLLLNVV